MKCEQCGELLSALKEMREACCAAMRVIANLDALKQVGAEADNRAQRFADELKTLGIAKGFGVRAQEAISKVEALAKGSR